MRARLALLAFVAIPAVASAAIPGVEYRPHQSSQDFALELKLNFFKPEIDSAPGLSGTPYESTFGSDTRTGLGAEFDWQLLRDPRIGSFALGAGVGRWATTAKALNYVDLTPTGDDTTLHLWQFAALGVVRFEALAHAGVPLVPFAKAGMGYTLWRSYGPDGTYASRQTGGNRALGGSYGFQWSAGLALLLDTFDPSSAKNMDEATGVNNTYVFVEYTDATLNQASSGSALRVGGESLSGGLALEF